MRQNKNVIQSFDKNLIYDFIGENAIPQAITETKGNTSYSISCYYSWAQPSQRSLQFVQEFGPTTQMFFKFHKPLNISSQFYYQQEDDLVQIYPCSNVGSNIKRLQHPKQSQWFSEAKKLYNQIMEKKQIKTSISRTYVTYPQLVSFTQVLPIIDENLNFKGAWCFNTFAKEVRTFFGSTSIFKQNIILVVDQVGQLLVHNYTQYMDQPLFFYNKTITGFDEQDWNSLIKTHKSNCQGILDMICLKNSNNNFAYNINVYHNNKYFFYILMLVSDEDYMEFQNEFFNKFHEFISSTLSRYIQTFLYFSTLLIVIVYTLGYLLFNPLNKFLSQQQNQLIKRNNFLFIQQENNFKKLTKQLFQYKINSSYVNSQVRKFIYAFKKTQNKFNRLQIKKSQVCLDQENIEYPIKSWSYMKRCWRFSFNLKQNIDQMQDEQKPTYSFIIYDEDII